MLLIVEKERTHVVRLATLKRLNDDSSQVNPPLRKLLEELLAMDPGNNWEAVVDKAAVNGGSFRMHFNEKINKTTRRPEGRVMSPCGVWLFHFDWNGKVPYFEEKARPQDLSDLEWLQRGSVRLPQGTEMTRFTPPLRKLANNISVEPTQAEALRQAEAVAAAAKAEAEAAQAAAKAEAEAAKADAENARRQLRATEEQRARAAAEERAIAAEMRMQLGRRTLTLCQQLVCSSSG